MDELLRHIDKINSISSDILTHVSTSDNQPDAERIGKEIAGEEQDAGISDFDKLEKMLADRREQIDAMQNSIDNLEPSFVRNLSDSDRSALNHRFNEFKKIHEQTESVLNEKMEGQKEQLGGASNLRKAEEKYHILGEPDISYFSER
ncbi:hypothetical protein [Natronogracilivirga saccharolytica]|uniref:Uncharacterized protein n=1 Tax=Natronogracilivirga saccharolytica TaxID=2812953 RepID=A0A8J7UUY9_9BACT|nr:hypothetical protein [Natronogracilivirga saccharolytica]MBP3191971.1 hypothetical protein [Natronogracilivirga saccharolytica]